MRPGPHDCLYLRQPERYPVSFNQKLPGVEQLQPSDYCGNAGKGEGDAFNAL